MPVITSQRGAPPVPLAWVREAPWLHGDRARAYALVFAVVLGLGVVAVAVARFALGHSADYLSFWAAGRLALAGQAASAYDVAAHAAIEKARFPATGYYGFFYPPVYLLVCAPLALLPFYPSLVMFLGASLLAYLRVLRRLLPGAWMALFGFPGVAATLLFGQNGLLTTALFGAGLTALARRPALAGVCFGCLCYKPHLGLAVPLALVAARQWRAIGGAAATVACLVAASVAAFGLASWRAFLAGTALAHQTLEQGLAVNASWESTFRIVAQAGLGLKAAYAAQAAVSVGALVALAVACRRREGAIVGALPLASLLTTPFLLAYDLALLAVPMAWVVAQARREGGFLPWEKAVLAFAYVAPLLSIVGGRANLPLGPAAMLALFAVVLRRAEPPP